MVDSTQDLNAAAGHAAADALAALPRDTLERLLRDASDCIAWLDADERLAWVNPAVLRMTGYPPADCQGLARFPEQIVFDPDIERLQVLRRLAAAQDGPAQAQMRLVRRDGSIVWVSVAWQEVRACDGRLLGVQVSMRDTELTERTATSPRDHLMSLRRFAQRIMRQAREQEGDFQARCDLLTAEVCRVLGVSRAGIWLFGHANERLNCVSLYRADELRHADGGYIDAGDYPRYMRAISTDELVVAVDACTHELTAELAASYLRPQGIQSMLDAPIVQGGRTVGVLCIEHGPGRRYWSAGEVALADNLAEFVGLDLEARERQRLQALNQRLAGIVESTPDLVYSSTPAGSVFYLNPAGRRLLGLGDDEEIKGLPILPFVAPDERERNLTSIVPQAVADGHWSGETAVLTRDGERIPVWEHLLAHKGADGRLHYLSGIVRDLREQKRTEFELRARELALKKLNDELEQRVAERTRQVEEVNRNLETFAFSVSHDLKAPLRGIEGYSRLLVDEHRDALPEEARGFIDTIRQAALSMSELIDDLLAYSRIGRRELSRSRFKVRTAVARVLGEREHDLQTHRVQLVERLDDLELQADLECFLQIVRNLLDNAVKFTRGVPDPVIELAATHQGAHVVFSVKDNGCGFDMKYHDRIFSIFQRLHRAEDYPGTGVGLAIVSKAAERLGGRVWAQSRPGQGATFFLEVPA